MILSTIFGIGLPLSDPVLIFAIILLIFLVSPILLKWIQIPHLIGLIIAGIIIGFSHNLLVAKCWFVIAREPLAIKLRFFFKFVAYKIVNSY